MKTSAQAHASRTGDDQRIRPNSRPCISEQRLRDGARGVQLARPAESFAGGRPRLNMQIARFYAVPERPLIGHPALTRFSVDRHRPDNATSYENVAGQGVTARGSVRKPRPVKIPADAPSAGRAQRTGLNSRCTGVRRRPIGGNRTHSLLWHDRQSGQSARGSPNLLAFVAVLTGS